MEEEQLFFYKTNVKFTIGIRLSNSDRQGLVLNARNPYVAVKKSQLRDFLQVNHEMLQKNYLISCPEPEFTVSSDNSITDEQAQILVKNFFALKKRLSTIDSEGMLVKLRDIAIADGRSQKTVNLIDERIAEVSPVEMIGTE